MQKKFFFFIFVCGFCPKDLAFARKIVGLSESPSRLARTPTVSIR